jgi:hypothetical protein
MLAKRTGSGENVTNRESQRDKPWNLTFCTFFSRSFSLTFFALEEIALVMLARGTVRPTIPGCRVQEHNGNITKHECT